VEFVTTMMTTTIAQAFRSHQLVLHALTLLADISDERGVSHIRLKKSRQRRKREQALKEKIKEEKTQQKEEETRLNVVRVIVISQLKKAWKVIDASSREVK
jgi:hypothetical protein